MPRDLILGTAGHIDHGKTALVRALTGTDCDRLPEEKARGITIDIGFARLALGDATLGVVDVPGHERFVRNMLAGATGVDLALLAVAADDGVMPQTREHLDILKFLGVRRGVVALTKADLVGDAARDERVREVRELVRDSFLADVPVVPTSTVTGTGIDELKAALAAAASPVEREADTGPFRLAIDRAFVVQGHGTVVTGSVASGGARVEDELDWHRGDGTVERVRVRGLSNHGHATNEVHRGQRAGVNLAGVRHEAVRRGQELCAPGYLVPSTVLTVRLFVAAGGRAVKHRLPVRFHVGTAEVMGTVSLLDCDRAEPGQSAVAQLFLEEPVTTVCGQAFVVRDSSAEHTLGGGQVLQPVAHKVRRRHTEVIERVEQLQAADAATRVLTAAWLGGTAGVTPLGLSREAAVSPAAAEALVCELLASGLLLELALADGRRVCLHADRVAELEGRVLDTLAALHAENPLATTHDRQKVLARLDYVGDNPLLDAVVGRLLAAKRLVGDARRLARADFVPKLSANQRKLKDRIVAAHAAAGFAPPEPAEFANLAGGNAVALKEIFEVAVAEGLLVRVTDDIYLLPEAEAELRRRVSERLASGPGVTVAEVRDLLGTTRKFAVPICEYLDRTGLTRRDGDLRVRT
ncbi:translation elongation factor : Selenocysteine-specific elongation factor OS=uncultured planctomycete GN=HGMM_F37F03C06 PE=4 SV=1: GTP_EFTU: GTP_EFTU_D2: SelB-wing_3 [Gemmataceae bacterium]|nr:translation elongation factor : Selenocysteine-specific elongation factor OS=uncultured planctomycete GN=HGMM_F37F03C06 PE=4 SV=1: GTP_EFTU: GTP_EFTU_D2: SelB-wing_3 [Gemmataceae bacterium]VTU01983.1 translation elongation factor : Selenocysteine-specific elongation factor OS=uncultured planctomycete GN=HGMM_F37F03C06 PE=4 SV=1: GTP_EFTU: GTP_EFTU_D2: SelB-wing_3 [Gemmataceae bacterium]